MPKKQSGEGEANVQINKHKQHFNYRRIILFFMKPVKKSIIVKIELGYKVYHPTLMTCHLNFYPLYPKSLKWRKEKKNNLHKQISSKYRLNLFLRNGSTTQKTDYNAMTVNYITASFRPTEERMKEQADDIKS